MCFGNNSSLCPSQQKIPPGQTDSPDGIKQGIIVETVYRARLELTGIGKGTSF
jgi:hypothetical protein